MREFTPREKDIIFSALVALSNRLLREGCKIPNEMKSRMIPVVLDHLLVRGSAHEGRRAQEVLPEILELFMQLDKEWNHAD